ncbi:hypothetical protein [Rubidibacter lacunae]|nr:hypothetical protein [Rubidibacter lacunae]
MGNRLSVLDCDRLNVEIRLQARRTKRSHHHKPYSRGVWGVALNVE